MRHKSQKEDLESLPNDLVNFWKLECGHDLGKRCDLKNADRFGPSFCEVPLLFFKNVNPESYPFVQNALKENLLFYSFRPT